MFTQPDTIIPEVYNPQTLNHYTFEENSPYMHTDETGHVAVQIGPVFGGTLPLSGIIGLSSSAGGGLAISYSSAQGFQVGAFGTQSEGIAIGAQGAVTLFSLSPSAQSLQDLSGESASFDASSSLGEVPLVLGVSSTKTDKTLTQQTPITSYTIGVGLGSAASASGTSTKVSTLYSSKSTVSEKPTSQTNSGSTTSLKSSLTSFFKTLASKLSGGHSVK